MTIAAVLRTKGSEVETITAGARLADSVAKLGGRRIGALPVVEGGRSSASFRSATSSIASATMAPKCSIGRSAG